MKNKVVCSICERVKHDFDFSVAEDGTLNKMCMACQVKIHDGDLIYKDGTYIPKYLQVKEKIKKELKIKKIKDLAEIKEKKIVENRKYRAMVKLRRYYKTIEQLKSGELVYSEGHIKRARKNIARGLIYCRCCTKYLFVELFPKVSDEFYFDTCKKCLGLKDAEH